MRFGRIRGCAKKEDMVRRKKVFRNGFGRDAVLLPQAINTLCALLQQMVVSGILVCNSFWVYSPANRPRNSDRLCV